MENATPVESVPKEPLVSALAMPGAVVLAGALIALAVYARPAAPAPAPAPSGAGAGAAVAVDSAKVATTGEPFIGDPHAPLTIAYWFDYQCPFCQRHEEQAMPQLVKEYVDTGKAKVVFKDYQFLGPDSQALGQFGRAVWEAAPDQFYAWHKAVYDNQGTENTGWATHEKIMSITAGVLGAQGAAAVDALVKKNGAAYQKAMDADRQEGAALGVNGTPGMVIGTHLVGGAQPYAAIKQVIELALTEK